MSLIFESLNNKKKWLILDIIICIIAAVILPLLFGNSYEFYAYVALCCAGIIAIICAFIDFCFLHEDRRSTYYLSKPIGLNKTINIKLISNILFLLLIYILNFFIASISDALLSDLNYSEFVLTKMEGTYVILAWSIVYIFIIALSAILSGNSIVAFFLSIFNFFIPLVIYLLATYIFNIIEIGLTGINAEIMGSFFLEKIFNLQAIYFLTHAFKFSINIFYLIRLVSYCTIIYLFIIISIRYRKNEKSDEFIIFNGYKYFISALASLLVPIIVTMMLDQNNFIAVVIALIVLSSICYYVLVSVFNKSFKISISSLRVFIPFILILVIAINISRFTVNEQAKFIPRLEDIKAVYVGDSLNVRIVNEYFTSYKYKYINIEQSDYKNIEKNKVIILFQEKEEIEKVTKLHSVLREKSNQAYTNGKYNRNLCTYMVYFMKNGDKITRCYYMPEEIEGELREVVIDIARSEEYIKKRFRVLCDDEYVNNYQYGDAYIDYQKASKFDYKVFAAEYLKDYIELVNSSDTKELYMSIFQDASCLCFILEHYEKHEDMNYYTINFRNKNSYDGISPDDIYVYEENKNTVKYLRSIIE